MKRLITILILVALAAPAWSQSLQLRERVVCESTELRLADLVHENGGVPEGQRVIADAPRPGESLTISRARLQRRLWDWGWRGHLEGPESVRVECPAVTLSLEPLKEAARDRLARRLEEDGLRLDGAIKGWVESVRLADSRIRWQLDLRGKSDFRNRSARLRIEDSRGFHEDILLRFHCRRPQMVPVAVKEMKPGESLRNWEYAERDAFFIDGELLEPEALADAVCNRRIEKGTPLTDRNLDAGLMVRAGREVEIHLSRGAVTVTLRGVAQADGTLGDRVAVRHVDSGELRRYRVTGEGRVSPSYIESQEETS